MIAYQYIRAGIIRDDVEKLYANSLRLRKKIENNLATLPKRRNVNIRANAYQNLERMAKCRIDYSLTRRNHEVGYAPNIPTQDLINIMQNGSKINKVPPRPFLKKFKEKLAVEFPTPKEMNKLSFGTIKKNIEDDMDSQFAEAIMGNKLGLAKLKYRVGIPLLRSGKLLRSIRWRLYED